MPQVPHILFDLDVDVSVDERVSGLMSSVVSGATRPLAVGQEQSNGSGHEPIKSVQMVSTGQHLVVRAHVLIKRFTGQPAKLERAGTLRFSPSFRRRNCGQSCD